MSAPVPGHAIPAPAIPGRGRLAAVAAGLSAVLLLAVLCGLLVGGGTGLGAPDGVDLSPAAVLRVLRWELLGAGVEPSAGQLYVVWSLRLPEALLAASVGAALAVSGAVFQTTLRNPLADPLLLGVAAGASLAASIAIGLGASGGVVPAAAATAGAGGTLVFVFAVAGRRGRFEPATMVLAGVVASTFYSAITLFLLAVSPGRSVGRILQWTMGSFADPGFAKLTWAGPALAILCVASFLGARPLNLFVLGDDAARSAGLAVGPVRVVLYAAGAALTGVSVASAGVVGFVGLVVPHLARGLFGPDHRVALPASALLGASLCVLADAVARVSVPAAQLAWAWLTGGPARVSPAELPVGVVTALFGAPFFMALLLRRRAI